MLGENCPVTTPTPEDSGMSFVEQSGTPGESQSCRICRDFSFRLFSGKSQQNSCPLAEEAGEGNSAMEESGWDSDSESFSESSTDSDSELESPSAARIPSEKPSSLPSQENFCDSEGSG